jgi:imidazolonepropionase-like amidohydrolase
MIRTALAFVATLFLASLAAAAPPLAIRAKTLHTMGPRGAIADGVVIVRDGVIEAVGTASEVAIPADATLLEAAVAVPGLIDARSVVGLSGIYNTPHDQDQLERSAPIQPELRAIDAYNPRERLVGYLRGLGITTIHTGHAPGELISGQTCIVKTVDGTLEDALVEPVAMVAATLGPSAHKDGGKAPGTRPKAIAMLREELLKAQEYANRDADAPRSLRLEMLGRVLRKETPLLVTANRAQDIASALRLAAEFDLRLVLDSAAESYLLVEEIKAAKVPVLIHPTMWRAYGETENLSMETAATLRKAGIPIAMQSGFESYVPKTRVVLFEAAIAAANGLSFDEALAIVTIDAARILGIAERVGSIEVGKDADLALYDGDPFEYTTRCVGTVIDGAVVSRGESPR